MDRPVFVLASAWRSGSTLVQRVLSSGPELFVWGESHGAVERLLRLRDGLARMRGTFAGAAREHVRHGLDGFIANLNPERERAALACRAWLEAYYVEPTRALTRARWGFKEVRCDAGHARFQLELFPEGRVVLLVRDPISVLASMRTVSWYRDAPAAAEHWRRVTESFLAFTDPRALLLRFERLVADPAAELDRVAAHLDLHAELLDRTLFERKVSGTSGRPSLELPELIELHRPGLRQVAMRAGYDDPARDPRVAVGPAVRATAIREVETASRRVARFGRWLRERVRRPSQ